MLANLYTITTDTLMPHTPPLVLIVDDDWMNRELLQAHLAEYKTLGAPNGEKALELARTQHPDLILLDLRLPGMSGYEVCAQLRADSQTASIPVLIISALDDDTSRQRAIDAGIDDFLTRPFDGLTLHTRVRALLRMKALSDELLRREQILIEVLRARLGDDAASATLDAYFNALG
jgi:two-component system, cell cycle response regulator